MEAWVGTLIGGLLGGGGIGALLLFVATRKRDRTTEIEGRFDDASELSRYVNEQIEKAVQPVKDRVKQLEKNQDELHAAIRARETQLWLWDLRGREGVMPALPAPLLVKLGLDHLTAGHHPPETKESP